MNLFRVHSKCTFLSRDCSSHFYICITSFSVSIHNRTIVSPNRCIHRRLFLEKIVADRPQTRSRRGTMTFFPPWNQTHVSPNDFTATRICHLNSATMVNPPSFFLSQVFLVPLSFVLPSSRTVGSPRFHRISSVSPSVYPLGSKPLSLSLHRGGLYVTIVPWNWTSFTYRMSMTLSRHPPPLRGCNDRGSRNACRSIFARELSVRRNWGLIFGNYLNSVLTFRWRSSD